MYPLCLHFVSAFFEDAPNSGYREETKRRHVSTLSPLRNTSNKVPEVLRLGLEGTNPRISFKASVPIQINLCIDALRFECGRRRFSRTENYNARHPQVPIRRFLGCSSQDRTKLPDTRVLKYGIEVLAGDFHCAKGVTEAQEMAAMKKLDLDQPVIRDDSPGAIG